MTTRHTGGFTPSRRRIRMAAAVLLLAALAPAAAGQDGPVDDGWAQRKIAKQPGRSQLAGADLAGLAARLERRLLAPSGKPLGPGGAATGPADAVPEGWQVFWRRGGATPGYIRALSAQGKPAAPGDLAESAPDRALEVLSAHPDLFGLQKAAAELRLVESHRDGWGRYHVRFVRRVDGVPVRGEDLVVHLDRAGRFYAFNGRYSPSTATVFAHYGESVDAAGAVAAAVADLSERQEVEPLAPALSELLGYDGPTATLYLIPDAGGPGLRSAWQVEVRPNVRDRWLYWIDASTGDIVEAYNATPLDGPATATGTDLEGEMQPLQVYEADGVYYLLDASRPMFAPSQTAVLSDPQGAMVTLTANYRDLSFRTPLSLVSSAANLWDDPVAVSAHAHMGTIFEYYYQTHGRLAIDGEGGSMYSIVHVTDDGAPMENAYWSGTFIAYGDGGETFEPLARALDVAAHEMTHGVVQYTVNLDYRTQSGALNESLADVFAVMVDRDDWRLGEDIIKSDAFPSGALRDMADPHNGCGAGEGCWQPAHMDEFVDLPISVDNGGVHINSGIPNRACYLVARALGRDRTERLYYRVLDGRYVNRQAEFTDMRRGLLQAAADLYGDGSQEYAAVGVAFDSVGIVEAAGYEPPPRRLPTPGEQWILVAADQRGSDTGLYLAPPQFDSEADLVELTETPVYAGSGNPVTVAADGSFVLFVDGDNNLRRIGTDGGGEQVLDASGEWSSVALAPDGRRLAATTTRIDSSILLIDLQDPQRSRPIRLRHPTTQDGVTADVVLYADAMDWDLEGECLIYDAFNMAPTASGDTLGYWDVCLLHPEEGYVVALLPPQADGVQLGNPKFARTTSQQVVVDYYDGARRQNEVRVYDLVSGDAGPIVATGTSVAFPSFSVDDREIIFERAGFLGSRIVSRVELTDDRMAAAASPTDYLSGARAARWFSIRPDDATSVEAEPAMAPQVFQLLPPYPNPFNATATLRYRMPAGARAELTVYDVRGARVAVLALPGGATNGSITWDGRDQQGRPAASGVYLCRLQGAAPDGGHLEAVERLALVR